MQSFQFPNAGCFRLCIQGRYTSVFRLDANYTFILEYCVFSEDKKKAAPVKGPEVKRTRRDRGELEDIMFKLFERQPNWTLKQLVQETDQPAQFLKEILNELCVYNKRGTNQGTYELKINFFLKFLF
ncbi:hypothetical protein K7X08_011896 [Anisodus acutangulus]|uniref:TFIIF beta subunit HTH domain-containing protein n=1 Tax=Anisodus acutangulus TaxID=402998 RepID=A0A9Q1L9C7_9SOLA|nr:hypothetical protein K7X08_011896 [Anisodus acutangulus]